MASKSINVLFSVTSSFTPAAPLQRQFALDTTNPQYLRYATMTQDSVQLTYFTNSVVFPLQNLYAAAASASVQLTWPPIILTQPTSSQTVTHPTASYFFISSSAEIPITYQWFSQSYSQSLTSSTAYYALGFSGSYTGSTTPALTHSISALGDNSSSYLCVATDARGATTSSVSVLYVL